MRIGPLVAGVVLLAAIPRLARILFFTPLVETDGAEYCRMAENLLHGNGYEGLLPGTELMFPPLYPLLIAGVMAVTGLASVAAARVVSLAAGLALVAIMTLLVDRMAGRRAAWIGGVLTALLPATVLVSASTFSESTQFALLAGGLLLAARAMAHPRVVTASSAGILFGLAYLTRAESFALGLWAAMLLLLHALRRRATRRKHVSATVAFSAGFALACLPYPLLIASATGSFRLEAKSDRVLATAERFAEGLPYAEANFALNPDDPAPWLDPNLPWEGDDAATILARSWPRLAERTLRQTLDVGWLYVSGHCVGSLLFLPLIALALSRRGRRRFPLVDLWLLGCVVYVTASAAFYKPLLRYVLLLSLASVIWGARGLDALADRWARDRGGIPGRVLLATIILTLSTWRGAVTGFREFGEASRANEDVRTVGRVLATQPLSGLVMSGDARIAFYAGERWTPLPVTEHPELFFERLRTLGVVWVVVPADSSPLTRPGPWLRPDSPPAPLTSLALPPTRWHVLRFP
jgi:4-amino-4-deoxy-L-arabinose transferase-like glycosyltransferase